MQLKIKKINYNLFAITIIIRILFTINLILQLITLKLTLNNYKNINNMIIQNYFNSAMIRSLISNTVSGGIHTDSS